MFHGDTHCVHLSQNCSFSEEQRLPGVHQDQVKVGLPGSVRGPRLRTAHKSEPVAGKLENRICLRFASSVGFLPLDHGGS